MKNIFRPLVQGVRASKKELLRYLLFLLIPLILGLILLLITRSTINSQIEANASLKLDLVEEASNNILSEAERTAVSILSDSDILEIVNNDSYSTTETQALIDRLNLYYQNSRYIQEIYFLNQAQDLILTQYGYFFYKSVAGLFSSVDTAIIIDPSTIPEGWNNANANYAPPYYIARFETANADNEPIFLIITLKRLDFVRSMYTVDADLCCLYNDQCEISTLLLSHGDVDWESNQSVSDLLGKQVITVNRSREHFNYVVAIGVKEYMRPLHYILIAFLVYFVLVTVYYLFTFTREYRRRYARISALAASLPRAGKQGSSYEELWQEVHSSVIQLRENEQSTQELKRARNMRYLISGYQNADYDLLRSSGIEPSRGYYAATLFISNYGRIWTNSETKEAIQVLDVIFQTAFERFEDEGFSTACVDTYPNYSVVFSVKETQGAKEKVRDTLEKVIGFLQDSFGLQIRCIVGRWLENAEDIGRSFEETLDTYDFVSTVSSESTVVFQEELDAHAGVLMGGNYLKQLQVLINTVLLDKYHLVPSMVDTLIQESILPLAEHQTLVRSRTRTISNILIETVFRSSLSSEEIRNAATYLTNCRTSPEDLDRAAAEIFTTLEPAKEKTTSNLVTRACDYIEQNLSDFNLSLPMICDAIGCSVQHLSRLFRAEKDTTINEYVHSQRIARSRILLQDGSLSVAQIAAQVGYASLDTFSRNFRRHTGMSPSEYRNNMRA